ncbi:winged helix-turn-helix transcriptional regulator [Amycolatopsis alba]|uniref:winged helix-turn-helix transcriptional regulator n=1 Tax=Amycolatopsis alba TaxID=76020 RepID=UPI0003619A68|nr:winged helix-turn-helix transcriptional regulator [Amycolatopsis alba]
MTTVESRTEVVQAISGKWTLTVMAKLERREIGFAELLTETELDPRQLSRVLEKLRQSGLVERFIQPRNSIPRPRYRLSRVGSEVLVRTGELAAVWAEFHERKSSFSLRATSGISPQRSR